MRYVNLVSLNLLFADNITKIFSFNGTEMVGLAAAEAADPRKSLPKAVKQVFWRIAIFYIVNLLIVGLNIPSDDSRLLNASNVNVSASPFVLAIQEAGIPALPSIINAVVLISVISVANSSAYGSTRTLQALALTGRAPRFFAYVDKKGRPIAATILQVLFGFLAYINCDESSGDKVFTWLMALGTLSSIFVFTSVNVAHFRFRRAMKLQGRSFSEIPWKSPVGTIGSFIGSFLGCLCLVAVFYSALYVRSLFLLALPPSITMAKCIAKQTATTRRPSRRRNILRKLPLRTDRHRPLRRLENLQA